MPIKDLLSELSQADLQAIFGVSDRSIQRWYDANPPLPRHGTGRGTFHIWSEVFPWYLAYQAGLSSNGGNPDKDRLQRAEADLAEMKRDAMAGRLLEAEDVERVWSSTLASFRAKLLNLPAKVAVRIEDGMGIGEREALLRAEVNEALEELVRTTDA